MDELPQCPLPPMPPRMSKRDTLLDDITLSDGERTLYQRNIDKFVWITHTVPEIMFAYKLKAKKNANPTELDMKHVDTIIKYLARLLRQNDITLVLGGDQEVLMIGIVDT